MPYDTSDALPLEPNVAGSTGRGASFDTSIADAIATTPEEQRRRTLATACGYADDPAGARSYLVDPSPKVRSAALAALSRLGVASEAEVHHALEDPSPIVRRTACELATKLPKVDRAALLHDEDARVVEACAFALGELEDGGATLTLMSIASDHHDPLCREAAVAALGAIGDPRATPALLGALGDLPAIRRRAVIALSNFEGEEIEAALRERLDDRDWQVRQAAEDILDVNAAEQP